MEDVKTLFFNRLHLKRKNVNIIKGWFEKTLRPPLRKIIGRIAILRIDVDWYRSTKICIESFYDKVIPGGYIVIDDYGHFPGCRRAIDEFLQKNKITVKINEIDYTGVYFIKPLKSIKLHFLA